MAELLIRVRDKSSDDPYKDVQLTKRGDVIVAVADGHPWGRDELANSDWRIVKAPGLSLTEAEALTSAEPGEATNRMLQRRAFRLDLAGVAIPPTVRDWIADSSRKQPSLTISGAAGRDLVRAIRQAKAAVPDPAVVGDQQSAKVIG